jgi:hypothetical protein
MFLVRVVHRPSTTCYTLDSLNHHHHAVGAAIATSSYSHKARNVSCPSPLLVLLPCLVSSGAAFKPEYKEQQQRERQEERERRQQEREERDAKHAAEKARREREREEREAERAKRAAKPADDHSSSRKRCVIFPCVPHGFVVDVNALVS